MYRRKQPTSGQLSAFSRASNNQKYAQTTDISKYQVQILEFRENSVLCNKSRVNDIVSYKHLTALQGVSDDKNNTFCIRETGASSTKRIDEGAKAKPHFILEKSIKESSIRKAYPVESEADSVWQKVQELNLDGFVGHWGEDGKLIGLRMDNCSEEVEQLCQQVDVGEGVKAHCLALDLEQEGGGGFLMTLQHHVPNWQKELYTGDYDLHELYNTRNQPLVEGSDEKARALTALNTAIARVDPLRSGTFISDGDNLLHLDPKESAYAMIQHGDQMTYMANQRNEAEQKGERYAQIVPAVAHQDQGAILTFSRGKIYLTEGVEQLRELREGLRLKVSSHWLPDEERKIGDGKLTVGFSKEAPKRESVRSSMDSVGSSEGGNAVASERKTSLGWSTGVSTSSLGGRIAKDGASASSERNTSSSCGKDQKAAKANPDKSKSPTGGLKKLFRR